MRRAVWLLVLVLGAATIGLYYLAPPGLSRSAIYEGLEVGAVIAVLGGVAVHRPGARLPWVLIALAILATAAGDLYWDLYDLTAGVQPAVSAGDVFYLGAYPLLLFAVALLVRRRDPARERGALIDTILMSTAAWVLVWQFLVIPSMRDATLPLAERAVVLAYPLMDVLLIGFVARLAWAPGTRVPSYWALLAGLATLFAADMAYAVITQGDGYEPGAWLDAVWLSSYLLLALSATHPSMRVLSEPSPRTDARLGAGRILLLGTALLVMPFVVTYQEARGRHVDLPLLIVASGTIAVLVVARFLSLTMDRERTREALRLSEERLHSLVQNASDAIAVFDPDTTVSYASPAVERLLGYRPDSMVGMSVLELVHPDDREPLERAIADVFLNPARALSLENRIRHIGGEWRFAQMHVSNRLNDPSVQGIVANVRDLTEQKEVEEELNQAVLHDPLTGLPNRMLMLDRLQQTLRRLERSGGSAALLFLDLDRFKVVNDSLGHDVGDRLLVAVSERLRSALRPGDTVARFGGDEFVMVCQDLTGPDDATLVAGRIASALAHEPFDVGDHEVYLTASIGVVAIPDADSTAPDLIRDADAAMTRAKELGRARYVSFEPSMRTGSQDAIAIESALHRALDQREFRLHYQPVIDVATGDLAGVEALIRWQHPDRGLLPPSEFVTLAEEAGLIVPIGDWVMEEACSQVRLWRASAPADRPFRIDVAVNLSAVQLREEDLVERVARILESTNVPPSALCLEITESVLMADTESSIEVLRRLKDLGVVLAVDDFGTGYSSLSYLKRFPVDILKVDRGFVDGLGTSAEDSAIVEAVVSLGHIMGLRVIAEGVDTQEQFGHLRRLRCDLAQGFLFSEALPPAELEARILGPGRVAGAGSAGGDPDATDIRRIG